MDPGLVDIDTLLGYQSAEAAGTGMVLSRSGEILTNNHVIEGATSISVTDVGNKKTYAATVVGYDRSKDISVLQLSQASGLKTVSIGNSSHVTKGQAVVGIGNAGGVGGTPTYAAGSVLGVDQSITASDEDGSSEQLTGLIETNAGIEAGDSGGPLVNIAGRVVGMDTAASAGFQFQSEGTNAFSIPIDRAISIAKAIESGQASSTVHLGSTAFLGVALAPSTGFGAFGNGKGSSVNGALIAGVMSGSPADQAGLTGGDVIDSFGDQSVDSANALTTLEDQDHPGNKVRVGWVDESGQSHTATVKLTTGPAG